MRPRLRHYALNALIAVLLAAVVVDALPQSPLALRMAIRPVLVSLGLEQGPWMLFAPDPGDTLYQMRAEITYRDGQRAEWSVPAWRHESWPQIWWKSRRRQWLRRLCMQEAAPAWQAWARHLARSLRPDLSDAERGAEVRLIFQEASIPPASSRPWTSWREPIEFHDVAVFPLERF